MQAIFPTGGRVGLLLVFLLLLSPVLARAQTFCVFDPEGAQGDGYQAARDYVLEAKRWGVDLDLKVYTDEGVVVEDFKAKQCDMMVVTGLRARQFNAFTGTIDSIGGLENYVELRKLMDLVSSEKIDHYMVSGPWEIEGIFPLGAGYAFVNDRQINKLSKAAGKKIGVMEWDKTEAMLVEAIGGQPVLSDFTNYAGRFNNGQVDIIVAPLIMFRPFELYKGLGTKGAIARFPILQLTAQIVAWHDRFPPDFGRLSRNYNTKQVDHAFAYIRQQEADVDSKYWMHVPLADRDGYTQIMRQARLALAKNGFYDRRMLSILKRVRCSTEPDQGECSQNDE